MAEQQDLTPQQRFDQTYITSSQMQIEMEVSRAAILYARRRGDLPEPISINNGQIICWERAAIAPALQAWKEFRNFKRSKQS